MKVCRASLCLSPEGDRQFFAAWFFLHLQENTGMSSAQDILDRLMTTCNRKSLSDGSVAFMWGLQSWGSDLAEISLLEKAVSLIDSEHYKFLVANEMKEVFINSGHYSHAEFDTLLKEYGY